MVEYFGERKRGAGGDVGWQVALCKIMLHTHLFRYKYLPAFSSHSGFYFPILDGWFNVSVSVLRPAAFIDSSRI